MNSKKDEYIELGAKVFNEFLGAVSIDWDEAYYRYVDYGDNHFSSQWSIKLNREIKLIEVDEDVEDKYLQFLQGITEKINNEIDKEGNARSIVIVLKLDRSGEFKYSFDNSDSNALEINKLALGKDNSYFNVEDIEIPNSVKKFQNELEKLA